MPCTTCAKARGPGDGAHRHVRPPSWFRARHARRGPAIRAGRTRDRRDPRLPRAIAAALADVPGARLRIHVFPEVLDPANERHRPALARGLRELDDDPALSATVVLDASGPKSDADLHRGLAECVAAVLPYAFGTHSGWLEMCRDLGMRVIVPVAGHYVGQVDRPGAVIPEDMTDPDAVAAAVREAVLAARRGGPLPRAEDPTWTTDAVARAHRDLYREVLGW